MVMKIKPSRAWLPVLCLLFILNSPVFGGNATDIPEILEPTPPPVRIPHPGITWNHRFHFKGVIAGYGMHYLRVGHRAFKKSVDIRYYDGQGRLLHWSRFPTGTRVGLILDSDLKILEVWKLPDI